MAWILKAYDLKAQEEPLSIIFRTFPWIVDIFNLSPYYFYKVIEVLIRAEDGLSRDVVKHLNHVSNSLLHFVWYIYRLSEICWAFLTKNPSIIMHQVTFMHLEVGCHDQLQ